jgi:uncharacterized protein
MTTSALYVGRLSHVRRVSPVRSFEHELYLLYLDLDELDSLALAPCLGVERAGLLSFRRRDYRGDASRSLKTCVLDDVEAALGLRPRGPVRLLTQVRQLGAAFNPVSFYYCFAEDGATLEAVLAEITNTPWGERHAYVVPASAGEARADFEKSFHVSPFLPMNQRYAWQLATPGPSLTVEMQNQENGREVFRARLSLERRPLTRGALLGVALRLPFMSLRILIRIYAHALRLWLSGARFFPHPKPPARSLEGAQHES